jgi:hypothetical protein
VQCELIPVNFFSLSSPRGRTSLILVEDVDEFPRVNGK